MSFAVSGLTICKNCGKSLSMNEYGLCNACKEKEKRKGIKNMSKVYKGYELLKAISDGEIKEGSLILFDSIIWIVDEYSDIVKYQEEHITLFNTYKAKEIAMSDFELIEDEIDIDSIEEMELDVIADATYYINDLIKAVKQLNKEVKELKNRSIGNEV